MLESINKKFLEISKMIGNTPLLEILFKYKGIERKIYAKAEYLNLTGSIKDRVAHYILKEGYKTGKLKQGDTIVEATSGNTGISFSALGSFLGHNAVIFMPDWMSQERIALMESFGAKVRLVSREEGGFLGSIAMAEEMGKKENVFLPEQFKNEDNVVAHELSTGEEISNQLAKIGKTADGVVAGVGTGGTVMGIAKRLKKDNQNLKVFPLEPSNSPTLSTGYKVGKHRIYGISDEFIPDILKLSETDSVVSVDDGDSINMARMISQKLGIGVGVSSGANFLGCILAQNMIGKDKTVVTVFADDNKKYLSTDYSKQQEIKDDFISKDVELLDVRVIV